MVREGVDGVGIPGVAKVNESVWDNRQDTPKPVKLELSRTAFCYGYTSGSLHLYHLEKVNHRKFYAYSEYGFKYTGYMVGDKVLLIPSV